MKKEAKEGMDKILKYIKEQDGYIFNKNTKYADTHNLLLEDLGYMVQIDTGKTSGRFIRLFFYDCLGIYNTYNPGSIEEKLLYQLVEKVAEYERNKSTAEEA